MDPRFYRRWFSLSLVLACWLANVDAATKNTIVDVTTVNSNLDAVVVNANVDGSTVSSNEDSAMVDANMDASVVSSNVDSAMVDPNVDATIISSNVDSNVVNKNVDATMIGSNVDSVVINNDVDAAMGGSNVDSAIVHGNVDAAVIKANVDETACSPPVTTPVPTPTPNTETTFYRTTAKPYEDMVSTVAANTDQSRDRVQILTDALSKAQARVTVIRNRVRLLAAMEKEKYCYVKMASDKVSKLVDNMEHAEHMLTCDMNRERRVRLQLCRIERLRWRSSRKLQVLRRLSVGAEVGLVHLESDRKLLGACQPKLGANNSASDGSREQRMFNNCD